MFLEIVFITIFFLSPEVYSQKSKEILHQSKFPPCKACTIFVDSFKKGMQKTARGKFEGGDTAWEEEKLGSYANSEVRLTEIQENICSDVEKGKDQCYSIHEEYDSILEEWWFHKQRDEHDLFDYFCINGLKYCCPDNHYGEDCTLCEGSPDNICSSNGKCDGAGTRKGNGKCLCNEGYSGDKCNQCADGYFKSSNDDQKLVCTKCHTSCDGSCTKAGSAGCTKCKKGWTLDNTEGCLDVNECDSSKSPCGPQQFCMNTQGSYKCINCDPKCKSCTGHGSDNCIECTEGYFMLKSRCMDKGELFHILISYLPVASTSFLGLFVVYKKSPTAAVVIVMAVLTYFGISR